MKLGWNPVAPKWLALILLTLLPVLVEAGMLLYVYELPDGSRMVSNHQLNNRHYKLIRMGENFHGVDMLVASRNPQFLRTNDSAYDDLIRRVAREHQVDFALVKAIMHVESGFNPYAKSHKGAHGLMQVLPSTAQRYGVGGRDIYDPYHNIQAGVRYLKFLSTQFHDVRYVIAAYNAGEHAVRTHGGIPPYQETTSYVTKVLDQQRRYARHS